MLDVDNASCKISCQVRLWLWIRILRSQQREDKPRETCRLGVGAGSYRECAEKNPSAVVIDHVLLVRFAWERDGEPTRDT